MLGEERLQAFPGVLGGVGPVGIALVAEETVWCARVDHTSADFFGWQSLIF